jgi:hypothetical protein
MNYERFLQGCPCGSKKKFRNCCKPKKLDNIFEFPDGKIPNVLPDWRIAAITQIAQDVPAAYPGGPSHKKGSFLTLAHHESHPRYGKLGFTTPHATALSLSVAVKNASIATETKKKIVLIDSPSPTGKAKHIGPDGVLFDYLEYSMVAVNFSFQSLESYCNSIVARTDDVDSIEIKTKEGNKTYSKKEIERNLSTEEKLLLVIPSILKLKNPKDTIQWHNFKKLKKIRDDIIHMKSRDMYSTISGDASSLFYELFEYPPLVFPKISFELIWLYSRTPVPRHHEPPWAKRFIDYFGEVLEKYS